MIRKANAHRIVPLLLLLVLSFCQLGGTAQATEPVRSSDNYTLKLFAEDAVIRNPTGSVNGYFEIYRGVTIAEPVVFDLWYSYSPTTRPDISTMTISVNGVPVASRLLEVQQAATVNWQVPLPVKQFRTGINEVSVSVVHRTIDGLCRDIDNAANWVIIRPESRVSFSAVHAPYTLSSYPRPFLDHYLASKINTVIYLPPDPDQVTLAALLNLGTSWGARGLTGVPQRLEVRIGEPGQVPANEVVLGLTSKWLPNQKFPGDAPVLSLEGLAGGYSRLLITGENSTNIAKAVNALLRPQLVQTFFGQQAVLSSPLAPESASVANIVKGKTGLYSLVDLGYETDIPVAGAFHQEAFITIPRPPNYNIGDGSYIELHFRHSTILDPKKSAVTIYINEIPVRAVALLAENAERGILKAPIPVSELNKPQWRVRFGFYHDLGIIDCSKRYDEVAWSVIEKETNVYLAPGRIERVPALEDFPNNLLVSPDGTVDLTMLLPEKPSQEEINAAFKLAYFIGYHNQSKALWQVQTISSFDAKKASGTVIALGKNDDAGQWGALKGYMSVYPEADGSFNIASWLEVMPAALNGFDIYQIGRINSEKLLYAFMYTDPVRVNNLLNLALLAGSPLTGQLTLVDAQGNHAFFQKQPSASEKSSFEWLKQLLSGSIGVGGTYLIIFIAVLAATLALMFFMRNRR